MLVKVQPTAQWGFSSVVEQCLDKAWVGGSNPSTPIIAFLAQQVEQATFNRHVTGSIPVERITHPQLSPDRAIVF